MLALITVDKDGVVRAIHDETQRSCHFARLDANLTLVCSDMSMKVLYASVFHKRLELGRKGLRDEGQDGLDADIFDEAIVLLFRVTAAVDAPRENSTVVGRRNQGL